MTPVVSVIIPCYNSGKFLIEAIESVTAHSHNCSYEILITNDGSNDVDTLLLLKNLSEQGYQVFHQENKGPGSARNTAIKNSNGEFLIFLDSDNKIKGDYIKKGTEILRNDDELGVVYANPSFFGNKINNRLFFARPFDICSLIAGNYVDMCSIVRKKTWDSVGGFDEERILIGHEDWEFWIRVSKKGWKFHYINEYLFFYRLSNNSLITTISSEKYQNVLRYIYQKHLDVVIKCIYQQNLELKNYQEDKKKPIRSFLKYTYKKYLNKG